MKKPLELNHQLNPSSPLNGVTMVHFWELLGMIKNIDWLIQDHLNSHTKLMHTREPSHKDLDGSEILDITLLVVSTNPMRESTCFGILRKLILLLLPKLLIKEVVSCTQHSIMTYKYFIFAVREIQVLNTSNSWTDNFITLVLSLPRFQERDSIGSPKELLMFLNVKLWDALN